MIKKRLTIRNRLGIHARPAAQFAKTASGYRCDIRVEKDGLNVNGKSIMGIMMLAAAKGNEIEVLADGPDEQEAVLALDRIVQEGFGEE
jgi:phosphocarrier protein HPr